MLTCYLILFTSTCTNPNIIIYETHTIPGNKWNMNDTIRFKTNISDINSYYDCYLDIRNSGDYPFSNLYLFIKSKYPDGKYTLDTLECTLADNQGKWLGKGLGDIKESRLLLSKNLRFKQAGNYKFEIVQSMRTSDLKGIYSIGIKIQKAK